MRNFAPWMMVGLFCIGAVVSCAPCPPGTRVSVGVSYKRTFFDVRGFGATGDGQALDTAAVNRAIAAAAHDGGGTVLFPAGTYRCHSIHLQSNVTLQLGPGAVLSAAPSSPAGSNAENYDAPEPNPFDAYEDFGHSHFHNSFIWGENLHDVAIVGPGLIDGSAGLSRGSHDDADPNLPGGGVGASWRDHHPHHDTPGDRYPQPGDTLHPGVGNKAIALKLCRNVTLRDFSIRGGGHFAILATGVDNFTVDNLKIDTNRDGMDIDSDRNVRISNCFVNSPWDDGICLKSDFALGYNRNCENITITNCQVSGWVCGSLLDGTYRPLADKMMPTGRIKFGTESNGGFKNITISNCVFDSCRGLALESVDGAELEDVAISNITMRHPVNSPIFLRLGQRMRGPDDALQPGTLQRVSIDNVVVYDADPRYASIITGTPDQTVCDIALSNLQIFCRGGAEKSRAWATTQSAEKVDAYPEPSMFGETGAYGFFVRHVNGITFNNVSLHLAGEDARPAFELDDVTHARFNNVEVPPSERSSLVGRDWNDVRVENSRSLGVTTRPISP